MKRTSPNSIRPVLARVVRFTPSCAVGTGPMGVVMAKWILVVDGQSAKTIEADHVFVGMGDTLMMRDANKNILGIVPLTQLKAIYQESIVQESS